MPNDKGLDPAGSARSIRSIRSARPVRSNRFRGRGSALRAAQPGFDDFFLWARPPPYRRLGLWENSGPTTWAGDPKVDFRQKGIIKIIKKPLRFSLKLTWWNAHVENLIKPVVYDHFWRLISPNDRKSIKKALGFSVKVEDVLRLRKTMKNHWLEAVLQLTENVMKTPYKTCYFFIHFGSFTQKGTQNPL